MDDSSIGLLGGKLDDYDDIDGICKDNLSFQGFCYVVVLFCMGTSDSIAALSGHTGFVLGLQTGGDGIRDTYGPQVQRLEDQYAGKAVGDPVDVDVCFIPALLERFFNPQAHVEAEEFISFLARCPYVITEDLSPEVLIVDRKTREGRWQKLSIQGLESKLAEFGELKRGEGSDLCTQLLFSARPGLGDSRIVLFHINVLAGNARVSVSKPENFIHPVIEVADEEVRRPDLAKLHEAVAAQMAAGGKFSGKTERKPKDPPRVEAYFRQVSPPSATALPPKPTHP